MLKEQDNTTELRFEGIDYCGLDVREDVEISIFCTGKEIIFWAKLEGNISRRVVRDVPRPGGMLSLAQDWLIMVAETFPKDGLTL